MGEIEKYAGKQRDGFDDYDDGVEGGEQGLQSNIPIIKFVDPHWFIRRTEELLESTREFVAVNVLRQVVKWKEEGPPETRVLLPGEKYPDIEQQNAEAPQEEWITDANGEPRGPYDNQHEVHLLDLETLDRFRFPTSTSGGHVAVTELVERVKWIRKFRGENVFPVVTLGDTLYSKRFRKQRPQFTVKRWIVLGADTAALPPPKPAPSLAPANVQAAEATPVEQPAPAEKTAAYMLSTGTPPAEEKPKAPKKAKGARVVDEPTLAEEMKDKIAF